MTTILNILHFNDGTVYGVKARNGLQDSPNLLSETVSNELGNLRFHTSTRTSFPVQNFSLHSRISYLPVHKQTFA